MKATESKILYLREMGMDDAMIPGDIKNHRVRVLENIDIFYAGTAYNMFFEFCQWTRYTYRTTNKRTGAPLKKALRELVNPNAVCVDTQFEKEETARDGRKWLSSWRNSALEKEIHAENPSFTRADILGIVNRYAIGAKYTKVVLIEEEARRIASTIGGFREKDILASDPVFEPGQWDEAHKVVRVTARREHKLADSFDVDLITGNICG
jgi:hypothetical protein